MGAMGYHAAPKANLSDRQTFLMLWLLKPAFVCWLRGFDFFDSLQILLGVAQELLRVFESGVCNQLPIIALTNLLGLSMEASTLSSFK
jgi:hypothetical protein